MTFAPECGDLLTGLGVGELGGEPTRLLHRLPDRTKEAGNLPAGTHVVKDGTAACGNGRKCRCDTPPVAGEPRVTCDNKV
ncbi:hypothetical protein Airi02_079290 [Actinoallomurus iriomotensis]|uniref:Uncharacterized protein n=1 Tax=Actinoallomurus iriomotensis TaxID=478107 RepID=A0A9W6S7X9_9ACTN|nr:hypothetical protein Airi02_079290 [Actinoallomurus iriomotensis]